MPSDYVFPFRLEAVEVLEAAAKANPADARAPYYLGNLLYDLQAAAAIKMWEKSAALDSSFALVQRNLALAYEQAEKNTPKAIATMERALQLDGNNSRFLYELDELYETGNVPPEKRLASFESHPSVAAKRSDALLQEIKVCVLLGRYEQALRLLRDHRFHNWEGEGQIHDVYMNACLLEGEKEFQAGRYREALQDYEAALAYPENLEVGRPDREDRLPQVDYLLGLAHEKLGDGSKSRELFGQAATLRDQGAGEMEYYQGLAALKLGQNTQAQHNFDDLIRRGEKALGGASEVDFFAKFGRRQSERLRLANAHYLVGLGNLGKGETAKARAEFREAVKLDVNHLGATTQLRASPGKDTVAP
jgi:tetratricopeptide (TPR) repeat protein